MEERDIDDLPKNEANYTSLTPLWFLKRAALVHPNRRSVVHASVQYTWQQTYRRCCRLASALSNHSVGFGSTMDVNVGDAKRGKRVLECLSYDFGKYQGLW
ncbi:putative acid--thiol ligase [Helianthus annuus]|nr:putative acid--thiol ligase [Helianthus annuus]